jgi:hypothetical protein
MSWTRRWLIIGSIALVQIGIIAGYQALPGAGETVTPLIAVPTPPPANGAEVKPTPSAPIAPDNAGMPPANRPGIAPAVTVQTGPPAGGSCPLPVMPAQNLSPTPQPGPADAALPLQICPPPGEYPNPKQPITPVPVVGGNTPPPVTDPNPLVPLPMANVNQSLASPKVVQAAHTQPEAVEPAPVGPCPWNLGVEIIAGRTHLTARNATDVQFQITCDKLDLQTPRGRIDATGKIKITSASVDAECERLTISWQEEVVVLEKVTMKCKLEGHAADMQADQLRLRLSRVVPAPSAVAPVRVEVPLEKGETLPPPK